MVLWTYQTKKQDSLVVQDGSNINDYQLISIPT
jgi:hypothetical protein